MRKNNKEIVTKIKDKLLKLTQEKRSQILPDNITNFYALNQIDSIKQGLDNNNFYDFRMHHIYKEIQTIKLGAERLGIRNPYFRSYDGINGAKIKIGEKNVINFASYNYLGLSGDPQVNKAAKDAIDKYGTSVSASRLVSGERNIHKELENSIAEMYGTEDALVFVSGHATNISVISCLMGSKDLILYDEYIHNSILLGIQLSGAARLAFPHNDLSVLDDLLTKHRSNYTRALIIVEGIYSMDGDFPDMPNLIKLKNKHKTLLMVDEAHSIGVMGERGFGIKDHFGLNPNDVDIWMGTLSKAFASCGGYITGQKALIEILKYKSPGFVYSVGMPPPVAAAALASIECLKKEPERVKTLHDRARLFLQEAKQSGFNTGKSVGLNIIPIIIGSSLKAAKLSNALLDKNINVLPIISPAVPDGLSRLRFFISCQHTNEDIIYTIKTLSHTRV